jgi:hypothetical protein
MTHTAPHPDEIRHFSRRFPYDSYANVKRAIRYGYKYPLRLSNDEAVRLAELDDHVINSAQVLPQTPEWRRLQKRRHPQWYWPQWQTVWFRDAETFAYVKMVTCFNSP